MAAITVKDIIESNRLRKEKFEAIKNDIKDYMSKDELEKLEEVFMTETKGCLFKRKEH